ncbi:MAG: hypothetical protein MUC36_22220 [Planctomycetes bacterium]|jgi:hypothetical protein|nr:hypothetical protein [Planctomycetota bacterium]
MATWRTSLGKLAFELSMVFIAVIAALLTNAWWQERRDRSAAGAALTAFVAEMQSNRKEIAGRVEHHVLVVTNAKTLTAEILRGDLPPADIDALRGRLTQGKGFNLPLVSRAAWDTALATGVVGHLPLPTVQMLASVYESQKRLESLLDRIIASWLSPDLYDVRAAAPAATSFLVTFGLLVELENNQLQVYEQAGKALAVR